MRIVVDTSVFVSALLRADTSPRAVLRLCLLREVQPLMGNALFSEFEPVTSRHQLFKRCPLGPSERSALMNDFMSVCDWISVYYLWRPNLRYEADNHLIELALAGNASHIVTGNVRDLKGADLNFPELEIVTANEFIGSRSS